MKQHDGARGSTLPQFSNENHVLNLSTVPVPLANNN